MANDEIRIQIRRGTRSALDGETPQQGEPTMTDDTDWRGGWLRLGDNATVGGLDAGSGNGYPGAPVNRWTPPPASFLAATATAVAANVLLYMPVCLGVDSDPVIKNLGVEVRGAAAGANVRLGLYRNEDGVPTDLILDSGNISVASTGFKQMAAASPVDIRPGWYWTAFVVSSATPSFDVLGTLGYAPLVAWSASATKRCTVHYEIHAFAALPATATPVGVTSGAYPLVHVQAG